MNNSMPLRCISSQLTTQLLLLRNPQGSEENWVRSQDEHIPNKIIHLGKVITTEIASGILFVTALVESVAYSILVVASVPLLPFTKKPLDICWSLADSSLFTMYWNVGNATTFNPFCINSITHESFARFSIDNWKRGELFKLILLVCNCALATFNLAMIVFSSGRLRLPVADPKILSNLTDRKWTRTEDTLYILDWTIRHQINLHEVQGNQAFQIVQEGNTLNQKVQNGKQFFKDYILAPGQITDEAKEMVLDADYEIFPFILTRCIYLYTLGPKKNAPLPGFLKPATNAEILKLRFSMKQFILGTPKWVEDHKAYEKFLTKIHSETAQSSDTILSRFNELRNAGSKELQNSIFLQRCWPEACQEVT